MSLTCTLRRNRGSRTCCAWLISLVETCPQCGRLRLLIIILDRIRCDGQVSVVERPSVELRNRHIGRRSWLPEDEGRSPSTQSLQLAPSQNKSQLIWGSIFHQNRLRRSFRGPVRYTVGNETICLLSAEPGRREMEIIRDHGQKGLSTLTRSILEAHSP